VAPGKHDELYSFLSGGFSGQISVYGIPSGRMLKVIPVFSQNPENGYGYNENTKAMLNTSFGFVPWDDLHHPKLSRADNHIRKAFFGIYLQRSDSCNVSRNVVEGIAKTESTSGNAIHLWYSDYNTITGNRTTGHGDGMYFEFAKECRIKDNLSFKNMMYTRNIVMEHNLFENNCVPGLWLAS